VIPRVRGASRRCEVAIANVLGRRPRGVVVALVLADFFDSLEIDRMDDTGMYVWAAILTVVILAASYAVAIGWQRWRAAKKQD
jgi:hypothetical protein